MLRVLQILVSPRARRSAGIACAAALLAACGQKGPLYLPGGEAAAGRASLPDTLAPSTSVVVPSRGASQPPTGIAAPAPRP